MNKTENQTSPQYLVMVSPEDSASAVECAVAKAMTMLYFGIRFY